MDTLQLENKWSKLTGQQSSDFITLKIDAGCKPDLDLGLNKEKHRCLLLRLPVNVKSKYSLLPGILSVLLSADIFDNLKNIKLLFMVVFKI